MLLRTLSYLLYLLLFVPTGWIRQIRNQSRFSQSFHHAPTSWDRN